MSMKAQNTKKMVPSERILLETDAPDALSTAELDSFFLVDGDPSLRQEFSAKEANLPNVESASDDQFHASKDLSALPKETLNHPANIHNAYFLYLQLLS